MIKGILIFISFYYVLSLFTQNNLHKIMMNTKIGTQKNLLTKIYSPYLFLIKKLSKKTRLKCEYIR
jgi:hypothetical protein